MTDALFVQIQLSPKGGAAKLFARVEANDFSGYGSAWIDPRELARLSVSLSQAFPLRETIGINGSYWNTTSDSSEDNEYLVLRFYPVQGRGVVGCQVRLASPVHEMGVGQRPETRNIVQVELLTSYQELKEFAIALGSTASSGTHEAVLRAVAV